MTDLLPQFNRISFLTLNRNRLFTAEQVCEIVEYYCEREREKVLDILDEWLNSDDHLSLYKWEVREKIREIRADIERMEGT